jgi:hypothetical protein
MFNFIRCSLGVFTPGLQLWTPKNVRPAGLKMRVLAYNLLHMIGQFYVWGEGVKRELISL